MPSSHKTEQSLDQITLVQLDQLPALRVRNASATALIALQGAQVLEFTAHGQKPLLWLSERAEFRRNTYPRGGIPVCWPWFGDLARNPDAIRAQTRGDALPAHGLVRGQDWVLDSIAQHADRTDVTLRYPVPAGLLPAWPHTVELRLTVSVGAALRLQPTAHNRGAQPLHLTQALHTYFAIGAIDQVSVEALDGARFIDTLQDWSEHRQAGSVRFAGEVDRIYLDIPAELRLRDEAWRRTVHIRAQNSRSAVVWNPHIEKTQRLSQMTDSGWRQFVCIETANVLDDAVIIAAGESHTLDVQLWSENL